MPDPLPGILGIDQPADAPAPRLRATSGGHETDPEWLARHRTIVHRARQGHADLLLLGDSITDLWLLEHPQHFEKTFAPWRTVNFAIRGDRTEHVLWRMHNGAMDTIEPQAIMLLIGTNNLPSLQGVYSARQPAEVVAGIRAILAALRSRWPAARILLPSIMPREDRLDALPPAIKEDLNPKVQALNTLIAAMADGEKTKYIDTFNHFLDLDARLLPGVMPDKLHPSESGYAIWAQAILPTLHQCLATKE